ncbi:glycosyltransferase [Pelagibius sp.]|uniref:glycosyltransferase n=1 Tax=Pelagibius sp. TaxID=1931238 RepID=UPI0026247FE0|nr:glycosyltransferase [Pelagibius sp.]
MPRVLQALAGAPEGGAEMHFLRLCLALRRAGVEQRVVIRPHPKSLEVLRAGGIEPVTARFGGLFDRETGKVLRREIADFGPDIALTYMSRASAAMPKGDFLHLARLGGYYDLKYYRRCDHMVCITPDIKAHCVKHGFADSRVHVIPNFVEDHRAPPQDRVALETPPEAPLVFALGRLHENKAFDILLEAVAKVPAAYLWLAGDGPLRGRLEQQAERLGIAGRVRFLGWQHDTAPYFAAADVYIVPSRHEPLGSVVLEGWMAGVPMIAAASQGPSWLVRDGDDGLLVPIDDAAAMAAAIQQLIGDPQTAERLVQNGRRRYEEGFTEAVAVRRYLTLFDSLMAGSDEAPRGTGLPLSR